MPPLCQPVYRRVCYARRPLLQSWRIAHHATVFTCDQQAQGFSYDLDGLSTIFDQWNIETGARICVWYGMEGFMPC